MVPTREKFGTTLLLNSVDPMYWERCVINELKDMMSCYSVVIQEMDSWFEKEGLNFKERA